MARFAVFVVTLLMTSHLYAAEIGLLTGNQQLPQLLDEGESVQPIDFSNSFIKSRTEKEFFISNGGIVYRLPIENIENIGDISSTAFNSAIAFSFLTPDNPMPVSVGPTKNTRFVSDSSTTGHFEGNVVLGINHNDVYNYLQKYDPIQAKNFMQKIDLSQVTWELQYRKDEEQLNNYLFYLKALEDLLKKNQPEEERKQLLADGIEKTKAGLNQASLNLVLVNKLKDPKYAAIAEQLQKTIIQLKGLESKYQQMLNTPASYKYQTHFDGVIDSLGVKDDGLLISLNNIKVSLRGAAVTAPTQMMFKVDSSQLNNGIYIPNPDPTQPRIESTLGEFIEAARDIENAKGKPIKGRALKVICFDRKVCQYDPTTNFVTGYMYFSGFSDEDLKAVILKKRNEVAQAKLNEEKQAQMVADEALRVEKEKQEKQAQVVADEAQRVADVDQKVAADAAAAAKVDHVVYKNILDIDTALRNAKANQGLIEKIFDDVLYCFEQGILKKLQIGDNIFNLGSLDMSSIPKSFPKVFTKSDAVGLNLSQNKLSTLEGLETIPAGKLRGLDISDNALITSVTPIVGHSLVYLIAFNTQVGKDMQALNNFARGPSSSTLVKLSIDNSGLTSLAFVGNLGVLESLSVSDNPFTSFNMKPSSSLKEFIAKRTTGNPPIMPRSLRVLGVLQGRGVIVVTN